MITVSQQAHEARERGQLSFFDGTADVSVGLSSFLSPPSEIPEIPRKTLLNWEKELTGVYLSGHPLDKLTKSRLRDTIPCSEIDPSLEGEKVVVAGMVTGIRTITTRKGDLMAFVRLEDLQGSVEVVVFPRAYEETRDLWQRDNIVVVAGRIDVRDGKANLICETCEGWAQETAIPPLESARSPMRARREHRIHITLRRTDDYEHDVKLLSQVYELLERNPGQDSFFIYVRNRRGWVQMEFPNAKTHYTPAVDAQLRRLLGNNCVRVE